MTEEEALDYVKTNSQSAEFPVVEDADVLDIIRKNQFATVWLSETEYKIGQTVQPTTPNGHFYICVAAGVSGETEPEWTSGYHSKVFEESTLRWQEVATDFGGGLYNLRNSIHEVWLRKAAKSVGKFDVKIESNTYSRSQIYQFCMEMARAYAPID